MRILKRCVAIAAAIVLAAFFILVFRVYAQERANRAANTAFAAKAEALQLRGKPRAFAIEHFGRPAAIRSSSDPGGKPTRVLVYIPYDHSMIFYPSYAHIWIDDSTDTVTGWSINSD
jgi:hypothetical protein